MIWFVLAGVLVVVALIIGFAEQRTSYGVPALSYPFTTLLFAGVFALILNTMLSPWYVAGQDDDKLVETSVVKLRSLDTGSGVSGSFFLGSGYIDDEAVYTYIAERADGGFKMKTINADDVVVYETDDRDPALVKTELPADSQFWSIFSGDGPTRIYVPKGSVEAPEFRIDTDRGEGR